MLLSIIWNPDPELFSFGALTVRWYGLIYATGFFIGITLLGKMFKHDNAPDNWLDKVFIYMVLAVIIGARLGMCSFMIGNITAKMSVKFLRFGTADWRVTVVLLLWC